MVKYWKIRAGSGGYLWDAWKREKIITVGWDIGDVRELDWDGTRDLIQECYDTSPGYATGVIRRFSGVYNEEGMDEDDIAVVLGEGTVLDIAIIGKYKYNEKGLPEAQSHTYWRYVNYYGIGPIRIRDLPQKFQQGGGDTSLHLPSTLVEYYVDEETINELTAAMGEVETVELKEGLVDISEESIKQYIERNFQDLDNRLISVEREFSTRVGDADFHGEDEDGKKVVIEVKIGTVQNNAVGQILGYINAIRSREKKKVRGILIGEGFTERVKEAVKSDEITLISFKTKLEFNKIQ